MNPFSSRSRVPRTNDSRRPGGFWIFFSFLHFTGWQLAFGDKNAKTLELLRRWNVNRFFVELFRDESLQRCLFASSTPVRCLNPARQRKAKQPVCLHSYEFLNDIAIKCRWNSRIVVFCNCSRQWAEFRWQIASLHGKEEIFLRYLFFFAMLAHHCSLKGNELSSWLEMRRKREFFQDIRCFLNDVTAHHP